MATTLVNKRRLRSHREVAAQQVVTFGQTVVSASQSRRERFKLMIGNPIALAGSALLIFTSNQDLLLLTIMIAPVGVLFTLSSLVGIWADQNHSNMKFETMREAEKSLPLGLFTEEHRRCCESGRKIHYRHAYRAEIAVHVAHLVMYAAFPVVYYNRTWLQEVANSWFAGMFG